MGLATTALAARYWAFARVLLAPGRGLEALTYDSMRIAFLANKKLTALATARKMAGIATLTIAQDLFDVSPFFTENTQGGDQPIGKSRLHSAHHQRDFVFGGILSRRYGAGARH
jgi:hypothetical protein